MPKLTLLPVLIWVAVLSGSAMADDYVDLVRKGNEAFQKKNYKEALELYRGAEPELPESPELQYNIANALHGQEGYEEAVDIYGDVLNTTDIELEASTHYNLGNTYYRMGDYQQAIESYQKSLEINPDDVDAKFNLELARKMLKEQSRPEQSQQDQQQQQQEQQQQQQEDQQDQQQEQQQQNEQGEQDEQQPEKQAQPQPQEEEKEMSKEDAERILNALKDDEQKIQEKLKRQINVGNYTGKDW